VTGRRAGSAPLRVIAPVRRALATERSPRRAPAETVERAARTPRVRARQEHVSPRQERRPRVRSVGDCSRGPGCIRGFSDRTDRSADGLAGAPVTRAAGALVLAGAPLRSAAASAVPAGRPFGLAGVPIAFAGAPFGAGGVPPTFGGAWVALAGGPVALAGGPVALAGRPVPLAGGPVALAGGPVTLAGAPIALAEHPGAPAGQAAALAGMTLSRGGAGRRLQSCRPGVAAPVGEPCRRAATRCGLAVRPRGPAGAGCRSGSAGCFTFVPGVRSHITVSVSSFETRRPDCPPAPRPAMLCA
jgi:hypothetical protein